MKTKFPNRIGYNVRSPKPKTEQENIRIYKQITKTKSRHDGKDIARFISNDKIYYGLIKAELNRSHDKNSHRFEKTLSLDRINE